MSHKRCTIITIIGIIVFSLFPIITSAETNVKEWINQEKTDDSPQTETSDQVDAKKAKANTTSLVGGILKTVFLLGLILVLIYLSLKLINKKNRLFHNSSTLENLGGLSLGQNKSIQVIRVGEKIYLIGVGDNVQLLQDINDEATRKELLDRASEQHPESPVNLFRNIKKQPKIKDNNHFSTMFQEELIKMKQQRETIKQQQDQGKDINE